HPQNLVEVPAGAGGIGNDQPHLLVRVDNKQRAYRQGVVGIGVDQVIQLGYLAIRIGNDGEGHLGVLGFVDILNPAVVGLHRVHAQGQHLDATLGELVLELGGKAQLGGAH